MSASIQFTTKNLLLMMEGVLNKAKAFGDAAKIDQKIEALREQLAAVEKALMDAVNIADVKTQFEALSNSEQ